MIECKEPQPEKKSNHGNYVKYYTDKKCYAEMLKEKTVEHNCQYCGNKLRDGIKFCTNCGKRVIPTENNIKKNEQKKIPAQTPKEKFREISDKLNEESEQAYIQKRIAEWDEKKRQSAKQQIKTPDIVPSKKDPLTKQLRDIQDLAKKYLGQNREEKSWPITRSGADQYTEAFKGVLGDSDIIDLIQKRAELKHPSMILDLMGYGFVIRDIKERLQNPNIKGLSVALSDVRSLELKKEDKDNLDCLVADVTKSDTWKDIRNWLDKSNVKGFDFILCRPLGGLEYLTKSPYFYAILLNKIWQVLNPEGGTLLTEVPKSINSKTMDNLCKYLASQHINVSWSSGTSSDETVLRLERTISAPEKLELPKSILESEK